MGIGKLASLAGVTTIRSYEHSGLRCIRSPQNMKCRKTKSVSLRRGRTATS